MVDPRLKLAFMQLVRARSMSVEQAAKFYGCSTRTIRRWCEGAPISCKIVGGSHRISAPLADLYVIGERQALRDFCYNGRISEVVTDAFNFHGVREALDKSLRGDATIAARHAPGA